MFSIVLVHVFNSAGMQTKLSEPFLSI